MIALRRHQLVYLKPAAWEPLIANALAGNAQAGDAQAGDAQAGDAQAGHAQAGLQHWAAHDLPLVVARQDRAAPALTRKLGLPLPQAWGRLRLSLQVLSTQIARVAAFPDARTVAPLLLPPTQAALHDLCDGLHAIGVTTRVYGSYGWQWLTGLRYVRSGSDLDLLMEVPDLAIAPTTADAVVARLSTWGSAAPRLDGELVFDNGSAVAWREWRAWRSGQTQQLLVKRADGVALQAGTGWLAAQPAAIASCGA